MLRSCSREYIIVDRKTGHILLFWRPKGVRYGETWHFSGTTLRERDMPCAPLDFVLRKYKVKARVSPPEYVGFVEIPEGKGEAEAEYELWSQLYIAYLEDGPIPDNAEFFPPDALPEETIPYHRVVIQTKILPHLQRQK